MEPLAHPTLLALMIGPVIRPVDDRVPEPRSSSVEPRTIAEQRDSALSRATRIFKALGHEGRLSILCHLMTGERSVSELEGLLEARQSVVSQHLARLRADGLVTARREGQAIFYSLRDERIADLLTTFRVLPDDWRR